MTITQVKSLLQQDPTTLGEGQDIATQGWVRSRRDSKAGLSFIDLNDGSSLTGIQVVAPAELDNYDEILERVTLGSSIAVSGKLLPSQGRGQAVEILAETITVLGDCDANAFPIQKQQTSLEHLRSIPHLRARTRTFQSIMRIRSELALAVHRFFGERGFYYVHTPIISASDCEGAGQMFRVSTLDPTNTPKTESGSVDWSQDFFGKESWLTVSGQLEGETYACGLGNIYTFGPTFRAENSNTPRHLAEFWMIEPEMAFCNLDGNRQVAEDFVKSVVGDVLKAAVRKLLF